MNCIFYSYAICDLHAAPIMQNDPPRTNFRCARLSVERDRHAQIRRLTQVLHGSHSAQSQFGRSWALLEQFDVLSLDVFDTAITRSVECPVDVFALAEERLVSELGSVARGYAELRETAEEQSRTILRSIGKEEVRLADILRQIAARRPDLSKHVALLHTTELACELEVTRPVPAIAALYQRAR